MNRRGNIQIGDLVLLQNDAGHKLENLFKGPYSVKEIDDMGNCTLLLDSSKTVKVHKNRLKIFNT